MLADLVLRQLLERREIDLLDQPAVQPHLGVEQLVAEQRIGRGARLPARLRRGRLREHASTTRLRAPASSTGGSEVRRGDAPRGETTDHALVLSVVDPVRGHARLHRAHESLSFFAPAAGLRRALAAPLRRGSAS